MKPFTVAVEGNIGSGKSTFLEYCQRSFKDITIMSEDLDQWRNFHGYNILNFMYENPCRWSSTFQSYVTLKMLQHHSQLVSTKFKFMERSIYSAHYCFVEYIKRCRSIHPLEYFVLDEWFNYILKNEEKINVDLIVYLKTSPPVAYKRIKQRSRIEESVLTLDIVEALHELHESWLLSRHHAHCPAPVLIMDANLDHFEIIQEYERIKNEITKRTKQSF